MPATALTAHNDGQQIVLDKKVDLPVNAKLEITVLPVNVNGNEEPWFALATESLALAYADDEPEYSLEDTSNEGRQYCVDAFASTGWAYIKSSSRCFTSNAVFWRFFIV